MTFKSTKLTFLVACAAIFAASGFHMVQAAGTDKESEVQALKELEATESAKMGEQQPTKTESTLTPEQKEEEVINEDNVMNPFPG